MKFVLTSLALHFDFGIVVLNKQQCLRLCMDGMMWVSIQTQEFSGAAVLAVVALKVVHRHDEDCGM